jgi:hypothetical protein
MRKLYLKVLWDECKIISTYSHPSDTCANNLLVGNLLAQEEQKW